MVTLQRTRYQPFVKGEIKPLGWLKAQLRIQADGLAGNLDKIWPDVRDSRWAGGDREGWERVPYWLDGFIPLAYLLDDQDMIARARKYMDHIFANQQEDGFLCPCPPEERSHYDMWALILIAKVLTVYGDLSGDERVVPALDKALSQFHRHIRGTTLFNWGAARWFECLIPIYWLYEKTKAPYLLDLAHRLKIQGFDYDKLFDPYLDGMPQRIWTQWTHVVNLAMALKQGALVSRLDGSDPNAFARKALSTLLQHHSMAVGHFTGDECVAGDSPVQGSELCGVVEAMYSYEMLLALGGDPFWGDQLEKLAFNALPATCSADMWTHQYDQQTNQIRCANLPKDQVVFTTNGPESHLFGLEPNFGCCTANMGQGWPKFAMSAFMREESGIAVMQMVPAQLDTAVGSANVRVTVKTAYPFEDTAIISVKTDRPIAFTLSIRIPGTAKAVQIDGQPAAPGTLHALQREWAGETEIHVAFTQETTFVSRPSGMRCLWRGPLLFALPIKENWVAHEFVKNGVERKKPYCDYEILPESPWAYAFAGEDMAVTQHGVSQMPFDTQNPPMSITVPMAPIPWDEQNGVCAPLPSALTPNGPKQQQVMIPYGCTQLRMTEMPLI